jgi:hypothetical protein
MNNSEGKLINETDVNLSVAENVTSVNNTDIQDTSFGGSIHCYCINRSNNFVVTHSCIRIGNGNWSTWSAIQPFGNTCLDPSCQTCASRRLWGWIAYLPITPSQVAVAITIRDKNSGKVTTSYWSWNNTTSISEGWVCI